jgi:hypothetical protein
MKFPHPFRHHPLWHIVDTLAIAGMLIGTLLILWSTHAPLWSLIVVALLVANEARKGVSAVVAWREHRDA